MGFKVALFNFYPPSIWAPGGADVMLAKVKSGLEELGIQVDLFNHWTRTKDFDILHVFGAAHETARLIESAKKIGKKVVVSTIFDSSKPFFYWWLWRRFDKLIPIDTTYTMRKKIFDMADILVAGSKYEARLLSAYFGKGASSFSRSMSTELSLPLQIPMRFRETVKSAAPPSKQSPDSA